MPIDDPTKHQAIITASLIAGAGASEQQVNAEVEKIAARLSAGSPALAVFDRLETRDANTAKVKGFPATIIGMDKELSSTRGVVFLRTKPSKWHPNGQEFVRTDRTDTDSGRATATHLQSLIGHKVFISVGVEGTGETNVRVVRGVEDKGIDPEYNPSVPGFTFDYSTLEPAMLARLATQQGQPQPA